jgi:hypothetical protein
MANKNDMSGTPTPGTATRGFQWRPSTGARTNCFRARGRSETGQAVEDWLQAERECTQDNASTDGATESHSHSVGGCHRRSHSGR